MDTHIQWTPHSLSTVHVDKIVCPAFSSAPEKAKSYVSTSSTPPVGFEAKEKTKHMYISLIIAEKYEKDQFMSDLAGKPIYSVNIDSRLQVSPNLMLNGVIHGISSDLNTIIIRDGFVKRKYPETNEQSEAKLIATLATWGADHGIYYFENLGEKIELEFDYKRWLKMESIIAKWSETLD